MYLCLDFSKENILVFNPYNEQTINHDIINNKVKGFKNVVHFKYIKWLKAQHLLARKCTCFYLFQPYWNSFPFSFFSELPFHVTPAFNSLHAANLLAAEWEKRVASRQKNAIATKCPFHTACIVCLCVGVCLFVGVSQFVWAI